MPCLALAMGKLAGSAKMLCQLLHCADTATIQVKERDDTAVASSDTCYFDEIANAEVGKSLCFNRVLLAVLGRDHQLHG